MQEPRDTHVLTRADSQQFPTGTQSSLLSLHQVRGSILLPEGGGAGGVQL